MTVSEHDKNRITGPRKKKGLVLIYTGNGKGKTTAALGVMFRAWGRGMPVQMFQFLKPSTSNAGEHRAAKQLGISIRALGDGFTWRSKDPEKTSALGLEQWELAKEAILAGEEGIIVLDELTYTMHYGWLDVADVIAVLRQKATMLHVIITGRYAPAELVEFADLVTDMTPVKHPYREQGIKAQPGLEF